MARGAAERREVVGSPWPGERRAFLVSLRAGLSVGSAGVVELVSTLQAAGDRNCVQDPEATLCICDHVASRC